MKPVPPPIDISGRREGVWFERGFVWVCRVAIVLPLVTLVWLLGGVIARGLGRIDLGFLLDAPSQLDATTGGIWPALMGSLWLIVITAAVSLPVGVGAALYLEEYGKRTRLGTVVEIAIANLAGVPSIIYGMLGLGLFVRWMALGETVIAGALTLALLVLPVVIMSSREALRTVGDSLREAALGLGATRWQTTRHVVLPMAIPGILTGAILAIPGHRRDRAAGGGGRGRLHPLRPRRARRRVHGPAHADLPVDVQPPARVPDQRRGRHRGPDVHAVPAQFGRHPVAQPLPETHVLGSS
ncbi:MAG: phosphate ABC transporter permease PstA [Kofleriaceae bacterium]|nr:phosphate ABC transporter permease PstA [Kofleriaceae bacterium]